MFKTVWDISNEDFINIVKESKTYRDVLRKCGYTNLGNTNTIKKRIVLLKLPVDHFVKYILPKKIKIPLSEILIENSTYGNYELKKKLVDELNWEYKCSRCGINDWLGEKITLELDHINGNNSDNRIDNLTFLCPNCHSLTSTFRGKNKTPIGGCIRKCTDCNEEIYSRNVSGYCKKCVVRYRTQNLKIKDRPSLATIENDLKELKTFVAVGKKYNVSDNTIRKWIRKYNNEGIQDLDKLKDLNIQ